jgi:nitrogen fixation protein NifQ
MRIGLTSSPGGHDVPKPGLYSLLMAHAATLPNSEVFARMLVSQAMGQGVLMPGLGLESADFNALMTRHFPGFGLPARLAQRTPLGERYIEWNDLRGLLIEHRADVDPAEIWIAAIVAHGCMGGDHLWQDLGLWARDDVTRLMRANFPALAARNTHDMKWKKFLYKQLCQQHGVYVCRAPSCEVCADYAKCFGPEG